MRRYILWVVRDCLSGNVLLARSLLSATAEDLTALLRQVADRVGVPIVWHQRQATRDRPGDAARLARGAASALFCAISPCRFLRRIGMGARFRRR
jgi:hypothetical protein